MNETEKDRSHEFTFTSTVLPSTFIRLASYQRFASLTYFNAFSLMFQFFGFWNWLCECYLYIHVFTCIMIFMETHQRRYFWIVFPFLTLSICNLRCSWALGRKPRSWQPHPTQHSLWRRLLRSQTWRSCRGVGKIPTAVSTPPPGRAIRPRSRWRGTWWSWSGGRRFRTRRGSGNAWIRGLRS